MTRPCPLDGCEAALGDHEAICRGCGRRLAMSLAAIPELLDELDVTLARVGSAWREPGGIRGRGTGGCKPGCDHDADNPSCIAGVTLDVNLAASEAAAQLRIVLHGWARVWDEETPIPLDDGYHGPMCRFGGVCDHASCLHVLAARQAGPQRRTRDRLLGTATRQALLLAAQPLAGRPWAPDMAREILEAVRGAERAMDRAPENVLIGTCGCGSAVYAESGTTTARCAKCGAHHNAADLHATTLAGSTEPLPKPDIALLLAMPVGTLHRWSSENRIVSCGVNRAGQPLYILGPIAAHVAAGTAPPQQLPVQRHADHALTCAEAARE